ncbi:MAG: hypothetical protein H6736_03555 [Alphaproteobacteria bacterium]|nr:hypothetical protein [Alphaproteobacteria bacterium]
MTAKRNVEICIDYDTEYDDNGNEDFWADNSVDRWARGVYVEVLDEVSTQPMYLSDTDGCARVDVEVDPSGEKFEVLVYSIASVKGVDYEVHEHSGNAAWSNQPISVEAFTASATEGVIERTTSPALAWQVMAAASWMWQRNRFAIWNGPNRDCCLEGTGGAGPDGTCTDPTKQYGPSTESTIHYFVKNTTGLACGGGNNQPGGHINSVEFSNPCRQKWLYSHESGHLVVGMRMDGLEQYNGAAPTDNCSGGYWSSGQLIDPGPPAVSRAMMSKGYTALAVREGWAEFYATWAWNAKNGADCSFLARGTFTDIDLDGTWDNDFGPSDPYYDFELDCAGSPWMYTDPNTCTDGFDWVDDLEVYNDAAGCVRAPVQGGYDLESNRSSVWDVTRMFWHLYWVDGLTPVALSDLYVDTCPRAWAQYDTWTSQGVATRPLNRLYTSSAYHAATQSDVDDAISNHVEH